MAHGRLIPAGGAAGAAGAARPSHGGVAAREGAHAAASGRPHGLPSRHDVRRDGRAHALEPAAAPGHSRALHPRFALRRWGHECRTSDMWLEVALPCLLGMQNTKQLLLSLHPSFPLDVLSAYPVIEGMALMAAFRSVCRRSSP